LTLFALTSLSCFSQTGISKDTTKVVISQEVAKQIAKDLVKYDGCVQELKLTQDKLLMTQQREILKDTTISLLTQKDSNNQIIIGKQQEQLKVSTDLNKELQKEIKRYKFEGIIYKVISVVGVLTTSYLLITN
jgi:hypothetical protein